MKNVAFLLILVSLGCVTAIASLLVSRDIGVWFEKISKAFFLMSPIVGYRFQIDGAATGLSFWGTVFCFIVAAFCVSSLHTIATVASCAFAVVGLLVFAKGLGNKGVNMER